MNYKEHQCLKFPCSREKIRSKLPCNFIVYSSTRTTTTCSVTLLGFSCNLNLLHDKSRKRRMAFERPEK